VPLPVDYITGVLMPWRESHGLPRIPAADELTPLCPPRKWVEGKSGLNSRMVLDIVKSTAKLAATLMPPEAQRATALLQKASNHWFRHTFITALIDDNVPVKTILTTVGQSSEQTLRIYDHKQDNDRHVDVTRVASKL
jgi:integrase